MDGSISNLKEKFTDDWLDEWSLNTIEILRKKVKKLHHENRKLEKVLSDIILIIFPPDSQRAKPETLKKILELIPENILKKIIEQ